MHSKIDVQPIHNKATTTFQPIWQPALPWAIAFIFFLFMYRYFPFHTWFEFDTDEGINVMKAMLWERGYPLYIQIWSDQPPVFTVLLATAFRILGEEILVARSLVLLFSAILVGAAFRFLQLIWGNIHAIAGICLILLLPYYLLLSVATMIGLPALTFGMLSLLGIAHWHRTHLSPWLFLSAVMMALSVMTKLFTGFLAPVILAGILIDQYYGRGFRTWVDLLRPALLWSAVLAATGFILAGIFIGPEGLYQLLIPHLEARVVSQQPGEFTIPLNAYLQPSLPILFLAFLGCLYTLLERRWTSFYLVAWIGLAFPLLSLHSPVWYHHQLAVTIPAALLGGIGLGEAARAIGKIIHDRNSSRSQYWFLGLTLIGAAITLIMRLPETRASFFAAEDYALEYVLPNIPARVTPFTNRMEVHAPETNWVVTDQAMYAFTIGRPVPPPLAVLSSKRLSTGELTEAEIIEVIETYNPEQVLLGRFQFPQVRQYLQTRYHLLHERGRIRLYLRPDLLQNE